MFTMAPTPAEGLPTPEDVMVPNTSVVALIVTAGKISHQLHTGLVRTLLYDQAQGFNNYRGEMINTSGANISKARNDIIRRFLEERPDAEWAWLIDSDMQIAEDTLPRLLCSAAVSGAKVMGALCCMIGNDGPVPTIFQLGDPGQGEVTRAMLDYPDNTILQVAATGMACLLIHRTVLEAFRDANPDTTYPWVYETEVLGNWVSEDIMFSLRANAAGFPVFVDCSTEIGHVKGSLVWFPSDIRTGRGFPQVKNYAIVPSKTDELAKATVRQLAGQGVERVYVMDNGLTDSDWFDQHGVYRVPMPDAGIHEMWNRGVDLAVADADQRRNVNLLFLNDDLEFDGTFVRKMVDALRSDPDMVAVSGNYDGRTGPQVIQTHDICAGRYDGTGGFAGFAFAGKGEWFQSGYRFPEVCKWWYGDNDLVQAAYFSGVGKVGIASEAHVVHLDGGSKTGGDWSGFADQLAADKTAFENRWRILSGGLPDQTETIAVVSSIYGGYDTPVTPHPQDVLADWVVVTDSSEPPPKPWRAIHKERPDVDPRYAAKAAKYQPFEFVDADIVVWLDGRVHPGPGFLAWLIDCLGDGDLGIYRHWGRSSILDEAEACLVENPAKYGGRPMVEQACYYLDCQVCGGTTPSGCTRCGGTGTSGYQDVNLWQSTFYVMRRNERTLAMGRRWQEEQDRYPDCLLDQIPLPPVIAECGVKVVDLPGGFWDYHGKLFALEPHIDGT